MAGLGRQVPTYLSRNGFRATSTCRRGAAFASQASHWVRIDAGWPQTRELICILLADCADSHTGTACCWYPHVAASPTTQPAELSLHFRPRLFHRQGPVLATGRPPYPIPSLHDPSPHGRCPPGICRRACEPSHRGIASSPTAANHGPPPPLLLPPPHTATVFGHRHGLLPLFSRTALPLRPCLPSHSGP